VFGLLFALTLGGERFALGWWIGALLILGGVLRVEWPVRPRDCGPARSGGTMRP
jgi:drug/metabolite transporter (DMT)-like permease